MATPTYSLPEAQERVEELQSILGTTKHQGLSADQLIDVAASLIRHADDLLAHLPFDANEETPEGAMLCMLTQTLRMTAFLLMQEVDPEQAWYWTLENQARIRELDHLLTPALRAEILAEAAADYSALEQDTGTLARIRAENALWDSTAGDGLDTD